MMSSVLPNSGCEATRQNNLVSIRRIAFLGMDRLYRPLFRASGAEGKTSNSLRRKEVETIPADRKNGS